MSFKDLTFGERLHWARFIRKLSINELAERAGIHSNSLTNYEKDQHDPTFNVVCWLSEALDVSLDYLAGRSDEF